MGDGDDQGKQHSENEWAARGHAGIEESRVLTTLG